MAQLVEVVVLEGVCFRAVWQVGVQGFSVVNRADGELHVGHIRLM